MKAKMFLGPGLILGMKYLGINMEDTSTIQVIRAAFVAALSFCGFVLLAIWTGINQKADEQRKVKVKQADSTGKEVEKLLSCKDYDMMEFGKLAKSVGINAAITSFVHIKWKVVPALVLSCVMTPLSLIESPLFRIYVLGQDADKNPDLKRPFKEDNPFAAMKKAAEEASNAAAAGNGNAEPEQVAAEEYRPPVPRASVEEIEESEEEDVAEPQVQAQPAPKEETKAKSSKQPIRLSGVKALSDKKKK